MKALKKIFTEEIYFLLACPAFLWQIVFLYAPFAILALHSILDYDSARGVYSFTLAYYHQIFNSLYIQIILRSFFLATLTALSCFVIAYPVAYYLALKVPKKFKTILLFSLILPSWTSLIVQVYAWFFILEKNSLISRLLQSLGVISPSFHLLNNYFSILLGMVSCYLPFMILPIYAVLEKMNPCYLEVSADLGADRFETFKRVIFPLSMPGVYAGVLLVFIPAFGEYAIPILLGGSKYVFWGSVIVDKFLRSRDWRVGAALVIIGVMLPALVIALSTFVSKCIRAYKERKFKREFYYISSHPKEPW
ncbi:MAG: ABC transporter permease [Candidatus Babeliales bacterium]|jgi:spermidine/putrescine transport system permease protein